MSRGQRFQDFVGRRFGKRLANRIFHWRIRWAVRRGARVVSAHVEETPDRD